MNLEGNYEKYHSNSKFQKRILSEYNFTYINLLNILKKYTGRSEKVLDVGCGTGAVDFYLASKGFFVTGVDVSKKAIYMATRNAKMLGVSGNTKFVVCNFPNEAIKGKYDLVVLSEVIEHLVDDVDAIKAINKLLRPNGILVLSTPLKDAPLFKMNLLNGQDSRVGHLRRYSEEGLSRILVSSNFKVLEVRRTEGIFRNFLFFFPSYGSLIVRVANRYKYFSMLLTIIDDVFLKMFGESQIYIVVQK
jgi:SAM-dependent methyltransferase